MVICNLPGDKFARKLRQKRKAVNELENNTFLKFIVYILTEKVLETAIEVRENVDPGQNVETLKENATTAGEVVQEEVKGK